MIGSLDDVQARLNEYSVDAVEVVQALRRIYPDPLIDWDLTFEFWSSVAHLEGYPCVEGCTPVVVIFRDPCGKLQNRALDLWRWTTPRK